jgi:hypothetical protein
MEEPASPEKQLNSLLDLHGTYAPRLRDTVNMKDPAELNELLEEMASVADEIEDYLDNRPREKNTEALAEIFSNIQEMKNFSPREQIIESAKCRNWAIMIFKMYPTVIDPKHLKTLIENTTEPVDGSVTPTLEDDDGEGEAV